jgi:hypothetical protein
MLYASLRLLGIPNLRASSEQFSDFIRAEQDFNASVTHRTSRIRTFLRSKLSMRKSHRERWHKVVLGK